ncbi:MAG: GNAT family N-acetyltransferase [Anaerolineae bacterium]|nr:GNAT family N-acetyltransferase [Phycisphaerae bacterium]
MSLNLRWVEDAERDRVAETRLRCYAAGTKDLDRYRDMIHNDGRPTTGDFLLAERDGEAIGTTTSLSMTIWVRGAALPCQGVAWVGTVRTARRQAGAGVASKLMIETVKRAREREQVVSALMPFRASFYEHFGYGVVENRVEWNVPLTLLPSGCSESMRFFTEADQQALVECRQRQTEQGQCDIETLPGVWPYVRKFSENNFEIVDRPDPKGPVRGWMRVEDQAKDAKRNVYVDDMVYDSMDALREQLKFLGGLRDQYSAAIITLPTDIPLNLLLRETQVPHRIVEHATPATKLYSRMQVRVLDHVRFFEKLNLPARSRGGATVAIRETEGHVARLKIEMEGGRAVARSSDASPDIECRDIEWAMLACGAVPATTLAKLGLITVNRPGVLEVLDELSVGPAPFCGEYF